MYKFIALIISLIFLSQPVWAKDKKNQPVEGYTVSLEISGLPEYNNVKLLSPIECAVMVIEFQDGNDPILRKRPGRTSCEDITFAFRDSYLPELWDWFENVRNGSYDRRSISARVFDDDGTELYRWNLMGTWPRSWKNEGISLEGGDLSKIRHEITFVVEEGYYGLPSAP